MKLVIRGVSLVVALIVMAGTLVAMDTVNNSQPALAANAQDFNAGNLISDSIFYNSATMSVGDIQAFLNARVPNCRAGYTCLKDYSQQTANQTAKSEGCAAYAGQYESAALIIYKVANACGINPQSLLVLLEKETSLITDTWPTSVEYRKAAGYGCPDTADCDSNYYGFFNQVYNAAWQFKKYQARPLDRGYIAGRVNTIAKNPDSGCGTSSVYIENQATAGLYVYTPYVPNAAALANLYGGGDACSSYGNRNFWRIFTDWFGTTQGVAPHVRFVELYNTGALGIAVSSAVTSATIGVEQQFQKGWAYWSQATGAVLVGGAIGNAYRARGGTSGGLGFPVAVEKAESGGGASQQFQRGRLYWSGATGAHQISGAIGNRWLSLGGPTSGLGYPTSDDTAMGAGSGQSFANGSLYWSDATGVQQSSGAIGQRYAALGGPASKLGLPVAGEVAAVNNGSSQAFQGGTIYWSSSAAWEVLSPMDAAYVKAGGPGGSIGYPTGPTLTYPGDQYAQSFTSGQQNWSVADGFLVRPAVSQIGGATRYETAVAISKSGYPTGAPIVYVATGADFPDALGAAPAAAVLGGPLLLTETDTLPGAVAAEIARLKPARIVVVGGEAVVSRGVMDALIPLAATVDRLAGTDRFDTARKVIVDAFPKGAAKVYVATGWDYPDALTAAAAAGAQGLPVVLVDGKAGTAGDATQNLLTQLGASKVTIAGAPAVVSAGVATSLAGSGRTVERLGGVDRFETALLVNKAAFPSAKSVFYATAFEFPDALAGAALAGAKKAPLYISQTGCVPGGVLWDLDRLGATNLTLLGGTGALDASVKALIRC